jgi:hypothetical protein
MIERSGRELFPGRSEISRELVEDGRTAAAAADGTDVAERCRMTLRTAVDTSPFNCRWVVRGSEHQLGDWSYAICLRIRNTERLVNERDCSRCALWEASAHSDKRGETPVP